MEWPPTTVATCGRLRSRSRRGDHLSRLATQGNPHPDLWAFLSQLDTVVREMRDPCVPGRADCCVLDTRARARRGEPAYRRWEARSRGFHVRTHAIDTMVCHCSHDPCFQ